jgi:hypothetical protein
MATCLGESENFHRLHYAFQSKEPSHYGFFSNIAYKVTKSAFIRINLKRLSISVEKLISTTI